MTPFRNITHAVKQRLGDLWWYTLILFIAQRVGDVVNVIVGLFLVPKYVLQEELGAVLPLASVGSLLGLPMTILSIPCMKFLNKYMAKEEYGKVKRLLFDIFAFTGFIFIVILVLAHFFMPFVFKYMRVENGRLSVLIIMSGVISALVPMFPTALQALKKFTFMSITNMASACIRLGTMLICLPIRGLSGYFVGQITPNIFNIGASLIVLRKYIGRNIKMVSYWQEDSRAIMRYVGWITLWYSPGILMLMVENTVIRYSLTNVESAAFYMISRFGEIALSFGLISASVLFPLVAENHEKGRTDNQEMLFQTMCGSLIVALVFAFAAVPVSYLVFSMKSDWSCYIPFIPHMIALCVIQAIRSAIHCYLMYETANSRFSFIPFLASMYCVEIVLLFLVVGCKMLSSYLPHEWVVGVLSLNPERLSVVLFIMFVVNGAILLKACFAIMKTGKSRTFGIP